MKFTVISTHFRLFNDFSSLVGGGKPQNNSDGVEPPSFHKKLETFSHKVFAASGAQTYNLRGERQVILR